MGPAPFQLFEATGPLPAIANAIANSRVVSRLNFALLPIRLWRFRRTVSASDDVPRNRPAWKHWIPARWKVRR